MMGYVQQANIAHGHQQVNNGPSRAGDIEIEQNKALEQRGYKPGWAFMKLQSV